MVHPRVRTCSESKDSDQAKSPDKIIIANGKPTEECHPLAHLPGDKGCPNCNSEGQPIVITIPEESEDVQPGKLLNDPWEAPELVDDSPCWADLSTKDKLKRVFIDWILKAAGLLALLYLFVCSLGFLASAFRLLGGKTAGQAFSSNSLLQNPVCGLMIGILATVLVQSSSTSTSIIITMVASEFLQVQEAIYIIMGANIGTSVTNTIVSMAQSGDRDQFRRAFAGATLHDMFNWLSVAILLPLEVVSGYLYRLTDWMTRSVSVQSAGCESGCKSDFLKKLTKPFTSRVIQLDKKVIEGVALGKEEYLDKSLIKTYCAYEEVTVLVNTTVSVNGTNLTTVQQTNATQMVGTHKCNFLFAGVSDKLAGILLLAGSLFLLCLCLILIVKLLNSVLKGKMAKLVKRIVNYEFPGKCSYFTGYVAMLLGAGMTVLVQSSSVFTSAMTPLVGMGVIRLERMYPLTLGSNIGTTATGLLAALAAGGGGKLKYSIQIALVHLFFNISGILLFYPLPRLRFPIAMAKTMGNTTAKYRWFAGLYLIMMFLVLPAVVFGLTMAGSVVLVVALSIVGAIALLVAILNVLQRKCKNRLPVVLRNWDFLPFKWMHSLQPLDNLITTVTQSTKGLFCSICLKKDSNPQKIQAENCEQERLSSESTGSENQQNDSLFTNNNSNSSLFDKEDGQNLSQSGGSLFSDSENSTNVTMCDENLAEPHENRENSGKTTENESVV